ncbi:hypothetical protein BAY61_23205 [Prauserella marina]|uniref:Sortase family protein n=1 Tax=Prauserella marina TaxID=530584 RepID=A0A222VU24_9PSEU|nr:sortase [Prauserella marina]ASR37427.1 hypothetical protein BAY61_23205 [Prauserella marina]PWV74691.1 sortase family protein [Prauserella marina]SDD43205.1 Sortase family protein [Prauserella marina]
MAVTSRTRRPEAGRLGIAVAGVIVTLVAVVTGTSLISRGDDVTGLASGPSQAGTGSAGTGNDSVRKSLTGPVPRAHAPLPRALPGRMAIPSLGLTTGALIELGRTPSGVTEVPGTAHSAGWLGETVTPGERGAAVVTGHDDFAYERGVFHRLGDLRPGDTITVNRADGTGAVFTVYRVDRLPADSGLAVATRYTSYPELRLLTTSGEFDDSTSADKEAVLAFARLTSVTGQSL